MSEEKMPLVVEELIGKTTVLNDHTVLVNQEATGAIYIVDTDKTRGADQAYRAKQVFYTRSPTEAEAENIRLRREHAEAKQRLAEQQEQMAKEAAVPTPPAPAAETPVKPHVSGTAKPSDVIIDHKPKK